MNISSKLILLLFCILIIVSCRKKTTQDSMFNGRKFKTKNGVKQDVNYKKTPPSVEYAKGFTTEDNPKKAAKKAEKELVKKKRASQKARSKHNKKTRVKVKTTKGRPNGSGS